MTVLCCSCEQACSPDVVQHEASLFSNHFDNWPQSRRRTRNLHSCKNFRDSFSLPPRSTLPQTDSQNLANYELQWLRRTLLAGLRELPGNAATACRAMSYRNKTRTRSFPKSPVGPRQSGAALPKWLRQNGKAPGNSTILASHSERVLGGAAGVSGRSAGGWRPRLKRATLRVCWGPPSGRDGKRPRSCKIR